jgi:fumarate hydratase subunit alpha/L(+)-tartrate dehydratase alpha subunit
MPAPDPSLVPARAAAAAYQAIEEAAKQTYIRALKLVPPDVKDALRRARERETSATGIETLDIILENIEIAEANDMLVCQDTGTVVFWVQATGGSRFDFAEVDAAIRRGTERATLEHPLRPNAVHPITRKNTMTNTGRHLPAMHYEFFAAADGGAVGAASDGAAPAEPAGADALGGLDAGAAPDTLCSLDAAPGCAIPPGSVKITCLPKGSGSENMSFLKMLIPADGIAGVKRFILECIVEAGPKPCPPTIVGVGLGGTADLCAALAKRALLRPLGVRNEDPVIAALEEELAAAANELGVGPMGLGGVNTVLGLTIEHAHTHITQNPVAVNIQCWAARRASAVVDPHGSVEYGF